MLRRGNWPYDSVADLLIGVTALHFGYAVGTRKLRHFRMVPNLAIVSF